MPRSSAESADPERVQIPWPEEIHTPRLVLRPLAPTDYPAWTTGFASRFPPRHKYDEGPHDVRQVSKRWFRTLCARHKKLWLTDQVYVFALFERRTGQHVGHVDIGVVRRRELQLANLGYAVHNTLQRRGYGTEACRAAIRFAFTRLGLHRLEAVINVDNIPSQRFARRLGMQREGVRKAYWFENDRWHDQVIYVAVADRFQLRP